MEDTMMNTTNDVIEEVAETAGGFSGKRIVLGVAIVAGVGAVGFAAAKLAKVVIAKIKAKKDEARASNIIDVEYEEVDHSRHDN